MTVSIGGETGELKRLAARSDDGVLPLGESQRSFPRPTLVARKHAAVGLTDDVTATAAAGTGWVTVTASFRATADCAVWLELRNNLDGFFPCFFDKLILA